MNTNDKEERQQLLESINRADTLPTEFIPCRRGALGHEWHLVQPDMVAVKGVRAVAMQCQRCLTIKRYRVGLKYGEFLEAPSYEYPPHYMLDRPRGERAVMPQAIRAVFAQRMGDDLPPIEPIS